MGKERVVKLLRSHRVRIARALVRQARSLAPRYEQIDALAMERSYMGLVFAVERVLEAGDDSMLADQTEQLATMRSAMGFQMEDFLLASLGWLPVVRTFLLEHGSNLAESIADYEEFEAVALPLVARAASVFVEAGEDPTQPNAKRPRLATSALKQLRSIPVERVSGSDDEEDEPTYRNFTPFTSSSSS
jgi:hypothetical protein